MLHAQMVAKWPVARDGYRWIDAYLVEDEGQLRGGSTRVLIEAKPDSDRRDWIDPMGPRASFSALFRQLALCDETEEAIADFASRFGMLACERHVVPVDVVNQQLRKRSSSRHSNSGKGPLVLDEPAIEADAFDDWISVIRDLKSLTRLSDALVEQDEKHIIKLLKYEQSGEYVDYVYTLGSVSHATSTRKGTPGSTPMGAIRAVLLHEIGTRIRAGYLLELTADLESGASSLRLRVPTLRHAIWLQFGIAIWENLFYRPCEVCGTYFLVSPEVARTDRTLCDQACKQKAHRMRHAKALELARRGLKPATIAKQVGSGTETVRRWLEADKGRRNGKAK